MTDNSSLELDTLDTIYPVDLQEVEDTESEYQEEFDLLEINC
jgi:hypothetical protein